MRRNFRAETATALSGERPAHLPCTIYEGLIPAGADFSLLRERGLALCAEGSVHEVVTPNVMVRTFVEPDGTARRVRETPVGNLTSLHRHGGYGALAFVEHPIKVIVPP